ncbi:MAG: aminoacyl-tRNA hydrolase [Bacteroidota bacterium]|nr:aminoacyl-tRNA hydrolase [Bacteroidota bacterium]
MKYLIAGLGNVGAEYENTRHNIGFKIVDHLAKSNNLNFKFDKHAFVTEMKYKQRILVIIKPTTYMNLSGKAVNYWLQKEKIPIENLLVVCDDIALPLGTTRIKPKGNDGGHNGLSDIIYSLSINEFARLRFGIGNDFPKGRQIDYVLGEFTHTEETILPERIDRAAEMIKSFATIGIERTMTLFNNK